MCEPQVTRWVNYQGHLKLLLTENILSKLAISVFTDIIFYTNLQSREVNLFHSAAYSQHV